MAVASVAVASRILREAAEGDASELDASVEAVTQVAAGVGDSVSSDLPGVGPAPPIPSATLPRHRTIEAARLGASSETRDV